MSPTRVPDGEGQLVALPMTAGATRGSKSKRRHEVGLLSGTGRTQQWLFQPFTPRTGEGSHLHLPYQVYFKTDNLFPIWHDLAHVAGWGANEISTM